MQRANRIEQLVACIVVLHVFSASQCAAEERVSIQRTNSGVRLEMPSQPSAPAAIGPMMTPAPEVRIPTLDKEPKIPQVFISPAPAVRIPGSNAPAANRPMWLLPGDGSTRNDDPEINGPMIMDIPQVNIPPPLPVPRDPNSAEPATIVGPNFQHAEAIPSPKLEVPKAIPRSEGDSSLRLRVRVHKNDLDSNNLTFGIIGIQWSNVVMTPTVVRTFPDTPAAQAGIQPGDQIISIDSNKLTGLSIPEVEEMMLGGIGTTVILSIQRLDKLVAAVMVRMDVDEIKDPEIRAAYGRTLSRMAEANESDMRF